MYSDHIEVDGYTDVTSSLMQALSVPSASKVFKLTCRLKYPAIVLIWITYKD